MKIRMFVSALVLSLVMALVAPNVAFSNDFYDYSLTGVDMGQFYTRAGANGTNAVPISIQTNVSLSEIQTLGEIRFHTDTFVYGNFVDPSTTTGPYYTFLENHGLHSESSISLTEITIGTHMGDISYVFDTQFSINVEGNAGIYRRPGNVIALSESHTWSAGAFPISSRVEVNIFEPGHPDFVTDWQVRMTSEWIVTSGFNPLPILPTPGAATLLGLAGLVSTRRRRR